MICCSKTFLALSTIALVIAGMAGAATGSEPEPGLAPPGQWAFSFTPYSWATWLKGDQTVRGRTVEVNVNPIELIEDLDTVPFMGYAEARRGPIALYSDVVYADVGLGRSSVKSGELNPSVSGRLSTSVGLDYQQVIAEVGGAYEIVRGPTAIDVLAGARYWHQDASIKFAPAADLDVGGLVVSRNRAIARSGSVDWVDPIIGARIRHQLAPGESLMLRGDIGGFSAGSQFSWNVVAAYSWELAVRDGVTYSGVLGYRLLDVDFEKGSERTKYEFDMLQHGPITGLTIAF